ncbi:MAG: ABC transporter permease [Chloroflexi bacterium]|nr:ABC transporter permease [Chloroflexota bacterium]
MRSEERAQELAEPRARGWSDVLRGWTRAIITFSRRSPIGAVSAVLVLVLIVVAAFPDQIAPYDPMKNNYTRILKAPNADFWMGNDTLGRDVLSRVIFGARISLIVSLASVALGTVAGSMWGLVTGYLGGWSDLLSQRVVEIIQSFPSVVLATLIAVGLGPGLGTVIVAITIVRLPGVCRVIRSVIISAREYTYVDAARAMGASTVRIVFRHMLPNAIAPFLILASTGLGGAVATEASLGFIGVGIPPPTPTWGNMLGGTVARSLNPSWWLVFYPGMAIAVVILAFNLFGDSLRDALDPRLRGSR